MTRLSSFQLLVPLLLWWCNVAMMVIAQDTASCPLDEQHEASLVIQYATTTTDGAILSPETIDTLEQGIREIYNGMQAGICDIETKLIVAVDFVEVQSVRRLMSNAFDDSASPRRQLITFYALYFTIYFNCRGCSSNTLFGNDAPKRRLRTQQAMLTKAARVGKKLFGQKLNRWIVKKRSQGKWKLKEGSVKDVIEEAEDNWGI